MAFGPATITAHAPAFTLPGLFVTGTDTGVGKTTVSCAILRACAGVVPFKPLVSGRASDETFEDIEKLRLASGMKLTDAEISPLRFELPLAPAVAGKADWRLVADRMAQLNAAKKPVLVEGVGGLLAPLDGPHYTIRELIRDLRLPVLIVARAQLGTLNHTAMTVELLRASGAKIVGVVMNGGDAKDSGVASNREWIEKMAGVKVLACVPMGNAAQVDEAMRCVAWGSFFR